jgi:AbrB family looped-hinge helix DNA binding protein
MDPHRVRLGTKGRLALPVDVRRALGVQDGDRLVLRLVDGEVRTWSPMRAVRVAQSAVRPYLSTGRSMVDELVAERRAEAARA